MENTPLLISEIPDNEKSTIREFEKVLERYLQ